MPASVWLVLGVSTFWGVPEGLPLGQERRARTVTAWLGAACVLALTSTCLWPRPVLAQNDTSSTAAPSQKKTVRKAPSPKTHAKTAAGSKTSSSSTAKAHSASHPATGKHPKSKTTTTAQNSRSRHSGSKKKSARGQQKIDPERAEAIQEALIREHYLTGEPTGSWNQASEEALRRYQADHGWQSKTVPDSRALISLGLGPNHDHLLNPESAMTTGPDVSHAASANSSLPIPVQHGREPGAHTATTPAASADPPPATSPNAPSPQ